MNGTTYADLPEEWIKQGGVYSLTYDGIDLIILNVYHYEDFSLDKVIYYISTGLLNLTSEATSEQISNYLGGIDGYNELCNAITSGKVLMFGYNSNDHIIPIYTKFVQGPPPGTSSSVIIQYLDKIVLTENTDTICRKDITINNNDGTFSLELNTIKSGVAIVDNLTSTDVDKALSANQGKKLKDALDNINIYSLVEKNAGAHNSLYRGKDLTIKYYSGDLDDALLGGTFDDIFIGDYIIGRNSSIKYLVADLDYRYRKSPSNNNKAHHMLMIPERNMGIAKMNNTSTNTGAYTGSAMYTTNLETFITTIKNDFNDYGNGGNPDVMYRGVHPQQNIFATAVDSTSSYETEASTTESDREVDLMNEIMVFGSNIYHNSNNPNANYDTIDTSQLSLFRLRPDLIASSKFNITSTDKINERYWLRDVAVSGNFCLVDQYGTCKHIYSNLEYGVRPAFLITSYAKLD